MLNKSMISLNSTLFLSLFLGVLEFEKQNLATTTTCRAGLWQGSPNCCFDTDVTILLNVRVSKPMLYTEGKHIADAGGRYSISDTRIHH